MGNETYLDIETTGINPDTDNIITIQYQRVDTRTGESRGELTILKAWESSEEKIVKTFYDTFLKAGGLWSIIPIGSCLHFEFEFLTAKIKKYIDPNFSSREFHFHRPKIDIHPLLVLMNNGDFRNSRLSAFTGKKEDGHVIPELWKTKDYAKIEAYIRNETESFLEFFQKLCRNAKRLLYEG